MVRAGSLSKSRSLRLRFRKGFGMRGAASVCFLMLALACSRAEDCFDGSGSNTFANYEVVNVTEHQLIDAFFEFCADPRVCQVSVGTVEPGEFVMLPRQCTRIGYVWRLSYTSEEPEFDPFSGIESYFHSLILTQSTADGLEIFTDPPVFRRYVAQVQPHPTREGKVLILVDSE